MEHKSLLKNILNQIKSMANEGKKARVVFDIDSTLVDVAPRIEKILADFVIAFADKYPNETQKLTGYRMQPQDYGFERAMIRLGLGNASDDFFSDLRVFWSERFFSSDYLHHDTPYAGAVEFVREIAKHAHVTYLTGRDVDRMRIGTIKSFSKLGFPITGPNVEFALKPDAQMVDAPFKRDFLKASTGPIWFFENEPENIRLVLEACPHIQAVFFDSVRFDEAPPPAGIPVIRSFLLH